MKKKCPFPCNAMCKEKEREEEGVELERRRVQPKMIYLLPPEEEMAKEREGQKQGTKNNKAQGNETEQNNTEE